jgi:hypothetical protein
MGFLLNGQPASFQEIEDLIGMCCSPTEVWLAKGRCAGVTHDGESPEEILRQKNLAKELLQSRGTSMAAAQ